jgi:hypothetical protein
LAARFGQHTVFPPPWVRQQETKPGAGSTADGSPFRSGVACAACDLHVGGACAGFGQYGKDRRANECWGRASVAMGIIRLDLALAVVGCLRYQAAFSEWP